MPIEPQHSTDCVCVWGGSGIIVHLRRHKTPTYLLDFKPFLIPHSWGRVNFHSFSHSDSQRSVSAVTVQTIIGKVKLENSYNSSVLIMAHRLQVVCGHLQSTDGSVKVGQDCACSHCCNCEVQHDNMLCDVCLHHL